MRSFDIFEIYPDGSLFWRVCVSGEYEKERKLQELREQSNNQFCALDLESGETFPPYPIAPRAAKRQAKAAGAKIA
jgi:hypothetical protein